MNIETPRSQFDRRKLVSALRRLRRGDFSVRLPEDELGIDSEIAGLFNEVVGLNEELTREFERLSMVVGKEGRRPRSRALAARSPRATFPRA